MLLVVWDTGIALHALAEAGLGPDDPDASKTAMWLVNKECRNASDWTKSCRGRGAFGVVL